MAKKRAGSHSEEVEEMPLSKAAEFLLQEGRMILPGIEAIFGFQLVVVFNPGFTQKLSAGEQGWHVAAIVLIALAMVIVMTPAAYHRQTRIREVSETFVRLATRLLLWSMLPLAAAILIEIYLVTVVVAGSAWGAGATAAMAAFIVFFWIVLPRVAFIKQAISPPK